MATSAGLSALEAALRAELPPEALAPGSDAYTVDGLTPSLVATPSTEDELSAVLRVADAHGTAVIATGARNHVGLGMPPERYDVALDLSKLNRIVEYSPPDLTVTVQAGVLLSELEATLAANGQWLPLDPHGPDGSIGGLLATNRSGPARIIYGGPRDLVIGLRAVFADGQPVKSGGRVVKNVAGYDLAKLHLGAIGTLGVIVEATFKVAPLPAETESVVLTGSVSNLMSTSLLIRNQGLAVNGLTLSGSKDGWRLDVRCAGGSGAVARTRREVEKLASRFGLQPSDGSQKDHDGAVVVRASLPPTSVEHVAETLVAAGADVLAYPTAGIVRGAWAEVPEIAALESLRALCHTGGGALVVEKAPVEVKQRFDVWGAPGADFELMQRLKAQFDPKRTLSPGRFVGSL